MGLLYEKVPIGDDLISRSLSEDNEDFTRQLRELQKLQSPFSRQLFRLNIILLLISTTLLATAYILSNPNDSQYVQKFSSYSPARPAVKYVSGTFNASQAEASGYIGLSNETEEMWNWVTIDIGDQMITPEELKLIDKPESSVKTKDPRSGKEGYRIGLEVFHQLHCLNLVRKATHREYYNGKDDFVGDEGKIRTHIDHCLEMLRMNIMCQVDIGVITFHERKDRPGDPWPDFNTLHVCRDFDAVREWAISNTVANDDIF